jgi:hypothetical protein
MSSPTTPTSPFLPFTLPTGPASVSQDHPLNANLRDNGIGLVPRIVAIDESAGSATLACGSILARLSIPLGWHIFDDGRRTLIFDEASSVQINLQLCDTKGHPAELLIQHIINVVTQANPEAEHITLDLADMKSVAFRGLKIADEYCDQVHMLKPCPGKFGMFCEIRVVCRPTDIVRIMDMAELIVNSLEFLAPPAAATEAA